MTIDDVDVCKLNPLKTVGALIITEKTTFDRLEFPLIPIYLLAIYTYTIPVQDFVACKLARLQIVSYLILWFWANGQSEYYTLHVFWRKLCQFPDLIMEIFL